ncbi:unnamed protein product [Effrenium voratum]|nr:unnamed protein product [Effrenium voratum]
MRSMRRPRPWALVFLSLAAAESLDSEEVFPVSLLQLKWQLGRSEIATDVEAVPSTDCRGSFDVCHLAKHEVCAYIPGCSWHGETAYGGWCSGEKESCAHLDRESCAEPCHWTTAWRETQCRGDLSRWQNPGCTFTSDREACLWMPGCNWAGLSAYGGWCTGNPFCSFETTSAACASKGCQWQTST